MKRNLPLLLLVLLLGVLLGGGTLLWALRSSPETARTLLGLKVERRNPLGMNDFFGNDALSDLQRMREEMEKEMQVGGGALGDNADEAEIVRKDDDNSVSFEVRGVEGSKLNTQVEGGYLSVSGELKKESPKGAGFSSVFVSSFHRVVPLPDDVDTAKMEMISEKDKVILRFPRKKHS